MIYFWIWLLGIAAFHYIYGRWGENNRDDIERAFMSLVWPLLVILFVLASLTELGKHHRYKRQ